MYRFIRGGRAEERKDRSRIRSSNFTDSHFLSFSFSFSFILFINYSRRFYERDCLLFWFCFWFFLSKIDFDSESPLVERSQQWAARSRFGVTAWEEHEDAVWSQRSRPAALILTLVVTIASVFRRFDSTLRNGCNGCNGYKKQSLISISTAACHLHIELLKLNSFLESIH